MNRKTITFFIIAFMAGTIFVRTYDFLQFASRKWYAVKWVMQGYNEEIVKQELSKNKAELQLVITKK